MKTFYDFPLHHTITRAVSEMGFLQPTPIQEQVIPLALNGQDLIGQAQTGTGKTAAFSIPLIEKIDTESEKIQGLVLAPTRELAIQVAEEMSKLGRYKGVKTLAVYGGQEIGRQIRGLKNRPQVIIATPGRLIDHLERRTIRLGDVHTAIIDEADEMLNMGFLEEIQKILAQIPSERQTMLFSATMPVPIRKLSEQFLQNPQHVSVIPKERPTAAIEQVYVEVAERQKFDALCRLIDLEAPDLAVVFGRTKRRVDELAAALQKRGYSAEGLHGDLSQNQRDQVMRKFREGQVQLLVATDVAARGIDVSNVTHVYNFDIPQDPESYVHRIGRTGRAGREGVAITLVTPGELSHLEFIQRINRLKLKKRPVPTKAEALAGQMQLTVEQLTSALHDGPAESYRNQAEELLEKYDAVDIVAGALKLLTRQTNDVQVELTPEKPLRVKKSKHQEAGFKRRKGEPGQAGRRFDKPDNRYAGRGPKREERRSKERRGLVKTH